MWVVVHGLIVQSISYYTDNPHSYRALSDPELVILLLSAKAFQLVKTFIAHSLGPWVPPLWICQLEYVVTAPGAENSSTAPVAIQNQEAGTAQQSTCNGAAA